MAVAPRVPVAATVLGGSQRREGLEDVKRRFWS